MTKITYTTAIEASINALTAQNAPAEIIEKMQALAEQVAKRNSSENRKPTKAQVANEELKGVVLSVLNADPATVTEIMGKDERLSALSNQKVSSLVNALVEDGKAVKTVDKRKSYFALA